MSLQEHCGRERPEAQLVSFDGGAAVGAYHVVEPVGGEIDVDGTGAEVVHHQHALSVILAVPGGGRRDGCGSGAVLEASFGERLVAVAQLSELAVERESTDPGSASCFSTEIPPVSMDLSILPESLAEARPLPSDVHIIGVRTYSSPSALLPQ